MRSPRLHVETPLLAGTRVELAAAAAHYLQRVLRLGPGATVRLFNARDGEWAARIEAGDRRSIKLLVTEPLRPPAAGRAPVLFVAPPKRSRFEWLVEKATELGVGRIVPLQTQRGVAKPERPERLRAIAVEAAEQCERLDVPEIEPLCSWQAMLTRLAGAGVLYADERGGSPLLAELAKTPDAALLVGPEGGFTAEERQSLRALPRAIAVSLGPRILRIETAALAMLACRQAAIDAQEAGS